VSQENPVSKSETAWDRSSGTWKIARVKRRGGFDYFHCAVHRDRDERTPDEALAAMFAGPDEFELLGGIWDPLNHLLRRLTLSGSSAAAAQETPRAKAVVTKDLPDTALVARGMALTRDSSAYWQ
jgi:hypothetical protein